MDLFLDKIVTPITLLEYKKMKLNETKLMDELQTLSAQICKDLQGSARQDYRLFMIFCNFSKRQKQP